MIKYWILIGVAFNLVSADLSDDGNKISPPQHWYHPPHHWHDCGSSEMDWNKDQNEMAKNADTWDWGNGNNDDNNNNNNNNNGAWVYPDQKPRPPWPPRPRPTPNPRPPPPPRTTTARPIPTQPTTKSPDDLQTCIKNCPVTSEYNPVCGTDGITYANLGRLECAKICGVNVQLARSSRCPTNGGTTSQSPPTSSTPSSAVQACITRCPVTPEYNPVCGSDGVTYTNPGRLQCAKACGVNVELARNSRCPSNQPITSTTNPTTSNVASSTASTNAGGIDFTIPDDILDDIFPTTPDSGIGLIDERFRDE